MAKIIISTSRILECDIVYCGSGYNNCHYISLGGKIKAGKVGAPDLEKPLISEPDDLARLDYEKIHEGEAVKTIMKCTEIVANAIGDEFAVTTTSWGPFTSAAQIYGVERMMHAIYKSPGFVKEILDFSTKLIMEFYTPIIESKAIELLSIADPTASGDLISKRHFREFALPYLQQLSQWARAKGVYTLLHICGDTSDRLELIREIGADLFSFDHKVNMKLARQELGGRMCIGGNVDPVRILAQGKVKDVETTSKKCIEDGGLNVGFGQGVGYVLMPGCDIPPTTPLENIKAFIHTARSYQLK
jgi:uroporphyrinogen decarboxylase